MLRLLHGEGIVIGNIRGVAPVRGNQQLFGPVGVSVQSAATAPPSACAWRRSPRPTAWADTRIRPRGRW